jgi:hypothetical protein
MTGYTEVIHFENAPTLNVNLSTSHKSACGKFAGISADKRACVDQSDQLPVGRLEQTAALHIVANHPLSYAARLVATLDFHFRFKDCFQRIRHVF